MWFFVHLILEGVERTGMKIRRRFVLDDEITYIVEEEVEATVHNMRDKLGKAVLYRGNLWLWQMFNTDKYPIDLMYTQIPQHRKDDFIADEIVGPLNPKKIKCNCGLDHTFMKGVYEAHMDSCDVKVKDPWA